MISRRLFGSISLIAVLIAPLGVAGMASYSAARRTQEIGIRKILGAGVGSIVRLMVQEAALLSLLTARCIGGRTADADRGEELAGEVLLPHRRALGTSSQSRVRRRCLS